MIRIALALILIFGQLALANTDSETDEALANLDAVELPPLHAGNAIVSLPYPIVQTAVQQESTGTVFLVTQLGNGHKERLRISDVGAVEKLLLFDSWPYILTTNGRLYAMDVSSRTLRKAKVGGLRSRFIGTLPIAALFGFGIATVSWLNLQIHGGAPTHYSSLQPVTWGLSTFFGYILVDTAITRYWRTPHQLGRGGNFFRKLITKKVANVEFDRVRNDFKITVRGRAEPIYLSTVTPAYTKDTACIYSLTKLNME